MRDPRFLQRLGATVGVVGGAVFVLANRGRLPEPAATTVLVLWALLAVAAVWAVWFRRAGDDAPDGPAPRRNAGAIYGAACVGMVVLIMIGSRLMLAAGHPEGTPAVVATAVGLHFVPFSHAFRAPFFTLLGCSLAAIGLTGIAAEITLGPPAASVSAVLAGLVMTGLINAHGLRTPPPPSSEDDAEPVAAHE